MPRITQDCIRRVRESVDIVDLIQGYVQLVRRGSAIKALCPFHQEKTPSFTVSQQRQSFKCFGCGEGGSAVDFLMKYEKLEFIEAIQRLADRGGVELEFEAGGPSPEQARMAKDHKSRMLAVMEWAQKEYARRLMSPGAPSQEHADAVAYLRKRGLSEATLRSWGIGYAPDSFDAMLNAGGKAGIDTRLLDECGITRVNDQGKRYDFFRRRVLFPIRDRQGHTVAFGGRKMREEDPGGKYINSPTTPVYDKSKVLYGIDRLAGSTFNRARPAGKKLVVVVEGYMDVIACHTAGIDCTVAPCGTALTADQLRTLAPYGDRIVLLLDADAAGQAAMEKVSREVIAQGLNVVVATLPDGKDPDEFLSKHPREALVAALDAGKHFFTFRLDALSRRYRSSNPAEKRAALAEALGDISATNDRLLRDELVRQTAEALNAPEKLIQQELRSMAVRQRERDARHTANAGAAAPAIPPKLETWERPILIRLLTHPELFRPVSSFFTESDFESAAARAIYLAMHDADNETGRLDGNEVLDHLPSGEAALRSLFTDLLVGELSAGRFKHPDDGREFDLDRAVAEFRQWHDRRSRGRAGTDAGPAGPTSPALGDVSGQQRLEELKARARPRKTPTAP
jgi:DNA primase